MKPESVAVTERMGCTWIALPGSLSPASIADVENAVGQARAEGVGRIVIDLERVEYLYSNGLGMLIRIRQGGGDNAVVLVNVGAQVRSVLESVNLDRLFSLYSTDVEFAVLDERVWEEAAAEAVPAFMGVSQVEKGVCRVVLSGHMTAHNNLSVLSAQLCPPPPAPCVVDMTGVTFIDSLGVGKLIQFVNALRGRNVAVALYGAGDSIRDIFSIMCLDEHLSICADEATALSVVAGGG